MYECPSCDYTGETQRGISCHHALKHGESIAGTDIECEWCGELFTVDPGVADERRFCSNECDGRWRTGNMTGKDAGGWNGGQETLTCDWCDGDFSVYPSEVEGRKFCSRECKDKHRANLPAEEQPAWKGGKVTVECHICGEEKQVKQYRLHRSDNFFCSDECSGVWMSENMSGEDNPLYNQREVECDYCGDTTEKIPTRIERSKRDFCSHGCHSKWESENLIGPDSPHWTGGRRDYGPGWNEDKREAVRERDGRMCHECGISGARNIAEFGRKLDVHHLVVPDSDTNPAVHNAQRNLVSLCIPCHHKAEPEQTPSTAVATSMEVCEI